MTSASWTSAEEIALIDFLVEHKAAGGDGGSFKAQTFQQALAVVTPLYKEGAVKTVKMLQTKWKTIKETFVIVQHIRDVSGWTWSDTTGASITADTECSWNSYVRAHPKAKPFRNKGWPYFQRVALLVPSKAKGSYAFYPSLSSSTSLLASSTSTPSTPSTVSPPFTPLALPIIPELVLPVADNTPGGNELLPMPPTSSHKRLRTPSPPPTQPVKRSRTAHGEALLSVSDTLSKFGATIATALAPPPSALPTTPIRRQQAITTAMAQESWLSSSQMVSFIDFLRKDLTAVDVYMILENAEIRKEWVQRQLDL